MLPLEIIRFYEDRIKALEESNNTYQSELNTYQKRCEQYSQAYDLLHHHLKELQRNRFGKKSERLRPYKTRGSGLF